MRVVRAGRNRRPDGSRYEGHWKTGRKEGKGKLVTSKGEVVEGLWRNDNLVDQ